MRPALAVLLLCSALSAQNPPSTPVPPPPKEEAPVVKKHSIKLGAKTLNYTTTTGVMPIRNENGDHEANMFYIAYTVDKSQGEPARPLTFSFNGGPGSASLWLHLGALGPKRVRLNDDGSLPPPPYQLVDNEATWLDLTDIVFIDPVGTGYSRATKPDLAKKFFGVEGDIASVGEFIRLYLTRNERWMAPLYLIGESYGTTRAAGLSGYLVDRGIALNGVILVSTILNFQTASFSRGNDLPYALFLPTYTATAWYHKKLPADLQKDLRTALSEAEAYSGREYLEVLAKGDRLTQAERQGAIDKLSRLTGLSKRYLDDTNLRIEIQRFTKELLRDRDLTVGRLDSRLTGPDDTGTAERPEFDPSMTTIRPPYTAAINQYIRGELGYQSDLTYYVLGGGVSSWDWGRQNQFADTSDSLRSGFAKNPHMRLFIGSGYYDLATPYFAAQYTVSHMGLPSGSRKNVTEQFYEAGHMFYIHVDSLRKLKRDIASFYSPGPRTTSSGE